MLRRRPTTATGLSHRARRLLWALATLDAMAAAWMISAGDWLDHQSRVTAAVTLGGHHLVVLWLAVAGFLILAVVAPMSGGFGVVSGVQLAALSVAGVASVVALAGILSVVGLVVGAVLLVAVVARAVL